MKQSTDTSAATHPQFHDENAGRRRVRPGRIGIPWAIALSLVLSALTGNGQPGNDDFDDAVRISGASGSAPGTNVDATSESGEPNHEPRPRTVTAHLKYRSVWWKWTAPANGRVVFDTFGSDFDTFLAIYIGDGIGSPTVVGRNDNAWHGNLQSLVAFEAVAGTTYRIAVLDGSDSETGNIALNWRPSPGNDHFGEAIVLTGASGNTTGCSLGATREAGEPDHVGEPTGASVWWTWTPPADGIIAFDTVGSDFDTVLAIYNGPGVDDLSLVTHSDDDCRSPLQSLSSFAAQAGTTYWIAIDGFDGEAGQIALQWKPVPEVALRITRLEPLPNARMTLEWSGRPGARYLLDCSSDLVTWTSEPIQEYRLSALKLTTPPSPAPRKFFRLRLSE